MVLIIKLDYYVRLKTFSMLCTISQLCYNHFYHVLCLSQVTNLCNFLENDFWMWGGVLNERHVAAVFGPLACPRRSARPRKCLN